MSIYITQQKKEELENKIKWLDDCVQKNTPPNEYYYLGRLSEIKYILRDAIVIDENNLNIETKDSGYTQKLYRNGLVNIKNK